MTKENGNVQKIAESLVQNDVYCNISRHVERLLESEDWATDDDLMEALAVDDWEEPVTDYLHQLDPADADQEDTILEVLDAAGIDDPADVLDALRRDRHSITSYLSLVRTVRENEPAEWDAAQAWWREIGDVVGVDAPHTQEALEFWLVSDKLADRLREQGEPVGDLDDVALWGRTCSGQAIVMDGPIQVIAAEIS